MKEEILKSEGVCLFCKKNFAQQGIIRHLSTHLTKMEGDGKQKRGFSFLVHVKVTEMFLALWVDGSTSFDELDFFLRKIWLECCGHMSAFVDPKGSYIHPKDENADDWFFEPNPNEVPMGMEVEQVFTKGKKLRYEYDFGSTTQLDIQVKGIYNIAASDPIVLLSRNEPLKLLCHSCGKKAATDICIEHSWEGPEWFFCPKCAKKHAKTCDAFEDYARMPVVNSPRMGVCAYEGGDIDKERDGVYKL